MEGRKKLPIYKMTISASDDESGVSYVALVTDPATERGWLAFSKDKMKFIADKERRIVTGALMVADLPIYRNSPTMGEFYVVFDKCEIEKVVQKFFKKGNTSKVNMMHDGEAIVEDVYLFESFIIDEARGIQAPKGFDGLTEGSWIGSYKVDNDNVWNEFIKTGEFTGFSVEGLFDMQIEALTIEEEIINIIDEISKL